MYFVIEGLKLRADKFPDCRSIVGARRPSYPVQKIG